MEKIAKSIPRAILTVVESVEIIGSEMMSQCFSVKSFIDAFDNKSIVISLLLLKTIAPLQCSTHQLVLIPD